MMRIEVDYPKAPPGAVYETDLTWPELCDRLGADTSSAWIPARSLKRDKSEVEMLNLNQVLRVRRA